MSGNSLLYSTKHATIRVGMGAIASACCGAMMVTRLCSANAIVVMICGSVVVANSHHILHLISHALVLHLA
jgi:hypothetical protein